MPNEDDWIEVEVLALIEEPIMVNPVLILQDIETGRVLPIWIGESEAKAVSHAYQRGESTRLGPHPLFARTLMHLGVAVEYAVIDSMQDRVYSAYVCFHTPDHEPLLLEARPSDSVILALEMDAPIYVDGDMFRKLSQENPLSPNAPAPPHTRTEKMNPQDLSKLNDLLERARAREFGEEGSETPR